MGGGGKFGINKLQQAEALREASDPANSEKCKKSTTRNGRVCQNWSDTWPNRHEYTHLGNHNHCRNPDGAVGGAWCYIGSKDRDDRGGQGSRWDYCYGSDFVGC